MSLLKNTKAICQQYQIRPLRRRGQNFLINNFVIKKILQIADLKKQDTILEIGSGLGVLTKELAKQVKKVIGVEIDQQLVKVLENELKDYQNIKIIQEDVRKIKPLDYKLKDYKVVANLPFNISGLVLKQLLTNPLKPKLIVLILQKEVGQRIVAQPPRMSRLSTMVQFYSQAEIVSQIKRTNFWPKPRVDSVILRIKPFVSPCFKDETKFFQIIRTGFSSPRKYLLNNLVKSAIIPKGEPNKKIRFSCLRSLKEFQAPLMISKERGEKIFKQINLNKKVRAQELPVETWIKLVRKIRIKKQKIKH